MATTLTDVNGHYTFTAKLWRTNNGFIRGLSAAHQVEFSVVRPDGTRDSVRIPKAAVALIRDVLAKLVDSERVAVLREDEESSSDVTLCV